MIILLTAVLGLLLPAAAGGRLHRLAHVRLRAIPVLVSAFTVQVLTVSVLHGPDTLLELLHIATYLAAGWTLWANRRIPGLTLLGLGALSNGLTITVNGGTLPANAAALHTAGLTDDPGFANSAVLDHPRLAILGDIFAVPATLPLANVFSIGDILIVAGATWASLRISGTRWNHPWTVPAAHTTNHTRPRTPAHRADPPRHRRPPHVSRNDRADPRPRRERRRTRPPTLPVRRILVR